MRIRELEQRLELLTSTHPGLRQVTTSAQAVRAAARPDEGGEFTSSPNISNAIQALDALQCQKPQAAAETSSTLISLSVAIDPLDSPPTLVETRARPTEDDVELGREFQAEAQFYVGFDRDITRGGLFVPTYAAVPIGSRVRLDFELPCCTRISVAGIIKWTRGIVTSGRPGIGVAFDVVPAEYLPALTHYCDVNEPLFIDF